MRKGYCLENCWQAGQLRWLKSCRITHLLRLWSSHKCTLDSGSPITLTPEAEWAGRCLARGCSSSAYL